MQKTIYIKSLWLWRTIHVRRMHGILVVAESACRLRISKINIAFRLKRFACLIFRQFRSIRISCLHHCQSRSTKKTTTTIQFRYMRRDKVNTHSTLCRMHPNSCSDANIRYYFLYLLSRQFLIILFLISVQTSASSSFGAIVDVFSGNVCVCVCASAWWERECCRHCLWIENGDSAHYSAPSLSYIFMCLTMNLFRKWKNSWRCGKTSTTEKP